MKFTKSFLAVAIAGIAAAPMMASATTTLSGVVELKIHGDDTGDDSDFDNVKTGDAGIGTSDVLFGIAAEQALDTGLTGYGSLRLDLDSFSNVEKQTSDSVYVGVKGGFGDLRIGEVPNPGEYGQVNDIFTDAGTAIDQGVSYVGSFGGATVGVAYSPAINQDIVAAGAKFAWNGLSLGVGMQDGRVVTDAIEGVDAADATDAVAAVPGVSNAVAAADAVEFVEAVGRSEKQKTNVTASVGFAFAGASIALGYSGLGDFHGTEADGFEDETAIIANVGYTISGVSLGLTYDAQQESESSQIRFDAGYALGGGMTISTRINALTAGETDLAVAKETEDKTDWRIQLSKVF